MPGRISRFPHSEGGERVELTWDTLFRNSSQPTHNMVFSPVDSLNKAMLKGEGASVPAAKYSFVWSGQNAMEDTIPILEIIQWRCLELKTREPKEGAPTFQAVLRLLRRCCVKPCPFVVTWSVNVEHLDCVFESAIYPMESSSIRKWITQKIPTRAEYLVALTLNERE